MTEKRLAEPANMALAFVDLAGFAAFTEAHGDLAAADIADRLVAVTQSALGDGDRLVKAIGDAVLLTSTQSATALTLVLKIFEECEADARFPDLRAAVHYGPVVQRHDDVFGATVNIAARIAGRSGGGQILLTRPVANAATPAGITVRLLGSTPLRNLTTPIELFEVVRAGASDRAVDPVCRMMVHPATAVGRLTYAGTGYLFCSLDCAAKFAAQPGAFTGATRDAQSQS